MSVFIFPMTFIGESIGDFVVEDPFRPESRWILTLLIFGSLRGDICIVLTPRRGLYPMCQPNFEKNFKKNQGLSPIGKRAAFCWNHRHADQSAPPSGSRP